MSNYWDPNSYSLENQILDTMGGKDVVTSDDGCVMKGNDHHVDIFWPSSSDRGHGHAGADYDSDGNLTSIDIYHN